MTKKMNKYYYPEPDELRVGLECEVQKHTGFANHTPTYEWVDKVISPNDFICDTYPEGSHQASFVQRLIRYTETIRVRYLDRHDLKEMFKNTKELLQEAGVRLYESNHDGFIINLVKNDIGDNPNESLIDIYREAGGDKVFSGKIKNRTELKEIMKMIR
jgi:adenylate kinase family enzyme